MGLTVQIKGIQIENPFEVWYSSGRTPGSVSEYSATNWGVRYTSNTFPSSTTVLTIDLESLVVPDSPFGKQFWFKLLDTVTGNFIIENIYVHDFSFYDELCVPDPSPTPTITVTPTVTFTPTPTSTSSDVTEIDCSISGTVVYYLPTTPTATVTPTASSIGSEPPPITPPIDPDPTTTPTPTLTVTPTKTQSPASMCLDFTVEYLTQVSSECGNPGENFDNVSTITVTLYDGPNGTPINATENITVTIEGVRTGDCPGYPYPNYVNVLIPNGSSSGSVTGVTSGYYTAECDSTCDPYTISYDFISSTSPSGYIQCLQPTPTPTLTQTPTPSEISCDCGEFYVTIDQNDINDASGNTGLLEQYNGFVIWRHYDCNTKTEILTPLEVAGTPGYWVLCGCYDQQMSLFYYKNNASLLAIYSNAQYQGPCST